MVVPSFISHLCLCWCLVQSHALQCGGPWLLAGEKVTEKEEQERKGKLPKTIKLPAQEGARMKGYMGNREMRLYASTA